MTAKSIKSPLFTTSTSRLIWWLLFGFGGLVILLVVVFYVKRVIAYRQAQNALNDKQPAKPTNPSTNTDGTPAIPGEDTQNEQPSAQPLPTHIETLCWMANEIALNGGKSDWRCEVCNNAETLGESDILLWASTYQIWYGRNLKDDLNGENYKDCGCILFFCGCDKPKFERLNSILA